MYSSIIARLLCDLSCVGIALTALSASCPRARMGLAISLVSTVPEKVWYHSNCPNRGKGCYNTQLVEKGGCAIWYNEPQVRDSRCKSEEWLWCVGYGNHITNSEVRSLVCAVWPR